jgi:hypothetical protein
MQHNALKDKTDSSKKATILFIVNSKESAAFKIRNLVKVKWGIIFFRKSLNSMIIASYSRLFSVLQSL